MIFLELFYTFFKIGLFTFGGGYAMIPMISTEIISKGWISPGAAVDFIAISESTPGPFAINIATFVGNNVGSQYGFALGVLGALCSTFGVILPSFLIVLAVSKFFFSYKDNRYVAGALSGIHPAVIGLISAAAIIILYANLYPNGFVFKETDWVSLSVTVFLFILSRIKIKGKRFNPIVLIGISALLGIVIYGFLL